MASLFLRNCWCWSRARRSLSSIWTLEMSTFGAVSSTFCGGGIGVPSREERADSGVAQPPSPATDWWGDEPIEALEGPLGYLNLWFETPPAVEDLEGQRVSFVAAAGDKQIPEDVVLFADEEAAGLGWPMGGDLRPSLSLNAKADDERAAAGEELDWDLCCPDSLLLTLEFDNVVGAVIPPKLRSPPGINLVGCGLARNELFSILWSVEDDSPPNDGLRGSSVDSVGVSSRLMPAAGLFSPKL